MHAHLKICLAKHGVMGYWGNVFQILIAKEKKENLHESTLVIGCRNLML